MTTNSEHVIQFVKAQLLSLSGLAAIISKRIYDTYGDISTTLPQMQYFIVTETEGYQVDFNSMTVQFSAYSNDFTEPRKMCNIVKAHFSRLSGVYAVTGGNIDINYCQFIDSGFLDRGDAKIHGQYLRYRIWYRGTNIS